MALLQASLLPVRKAANAHPWRQATQCRCRPLQTLQWETRWCAWPLLHTLCLNPASPVSLCCLRPSAACARPAKQRCPGRHEGDARSSHTAGSFLAGSRSCEPGQRDPKQEGHVRAGGGAPGLSSAQQRLDRAPPPEHSHRALPACMWVPMRSRSAVHMWPPVPVRASRESSSILVPCSSRA